MRHGRHFSHICSSRAEEAGRAVVRVNPAYTSQTCSGCGHRQEMPLSVRVYECPNCGLLIDRDYNGSKNILDQALEAVGRHGRVIRRAPQAPGAEGSRHKVDDLAKSYVASIITPYHQQIKYHLENVYCHYMVL